MSSAILLVTLFFVEKRKESEEKCVFSKFLMELMEIFPP